MALALRDGGVDVADAKMLAEVYHERIKSHGDHPYTLEEAVASVESAYSRPPREGVAADKKEKKEEERESAYDVLLKIVKSDLLFHNEDRVAFAVVVDGTVHRVMRVRDLEYHRHLSWAFYKIQGCAPPSEGLNAMANLADALAIYSGAFIKLWLRFAVRETELWIDLGDAAWRGIKVTAAGWEVVATPPTSFERVAHMQALPEPERGGDLEDLLGFLNITDPHDRLLVLAWLVVAPLAHIPRPIMMLRGIPGSAKTTMGRLLRSLIDPSSVETVDLGRHDPAELALVLAHHAVPTFDNLSQLAKWQEDLLCRAVTGGGFTKRMLYTDGTDFVLRFMRAMIVTGVSTPTDASDLLDRCVIIELSAIGDDRRKTEPELWAAFNAVRPKLLGALLDALSSAIRIYPTITLKQLPRMADFAKWGAAASEALGFGAQAFIDALNSNRGRQVEAALEDPVAPAVKALVSKVDPWIGTATLLLEALTNLHGKRQAGERWPGNESHLGKRLMMLKTPLERAGIFMAKSRKGGERVIVISRSPIKFEGESGEL